MFVKEETGVKQNKTTTTKTTPVSVSQKEKLDWEIKVRTGPEDV
jgi:hypothetical protein